MLEMAPFDTVEGKHHQYAMEYLYNLANFFKAAYNHEKKTDLWCYKERDERHPVIHYPKQIEVKEGTD